MVTRDEVRRCLLLCTGENDSLLKDVCVSLDPADVAARKCACLLSCDEDARNLLCSRGLEAALSQIYDDQENYVEVFGVASRAAEAVYGSNVANNLSYGEIGCRAMVAAFRSASRHVVVESMCDVGSGRGQNVVMASLLGVERCVGIEIVEDLHEMATRAATRVERNVSFMRGDARTLFQGVDFVLSNWICFDSDLIRDLTRLYEEKQAAGSVVVTFTTALQSTRFVVVDKIRLDDMPWRGPCTLFVHLKLSDDQHRLRIDTGHPTPFDSDQAIALRRPGEPYEDSDAMDSLEVGCSPDSSTSLGDDEHSYDRLSVELSLRSRDEAPM